MGAGDEKQTTQRDLSDEALAKSDDAKSATDATNCNYSFHTKPRRTAKSGLTAKNRKGPLRTTKAKASGSQDVNGHEFLMARSI